VNSNFRTLSKAERKARLLQIDDSKDNQQLSKIQKKAVNKVFDQIIEVNKYVNPINKKTLDAMKKETMIKNEQFLSNNGKGVSKRIENLYKDYI
jgi:hypothetical protein|tara:strand:+ start:109 stop:390 length:282 start_codon:yes stop_codon:yes gene_type:complete